MEHEEIKELENIRVVENLNWNPSTYYIVYRIETDLKNVRMNLEVIEQICRLYTLQIFKTNTRRDGEGSRR